MTTFDATVSASESLAFTPAQARWFLNELLPEHMADAGAVGIASWVTNQTDWPIERLIVVLPGDEEEARVLIRLAAHLSPPSQALLVLVPPKRHVLWRKLRIGGREGPSPPTLLGVARDAGLTLAAHRVQQLSSRHVRAMSRRWGRRKLRAGLLLVQWSRP